MWPLFYDFPDALDAPCEQPTAFLLGDPMLISPPPGMESPQAYRSARLPAGRWYDYWTGEPVYIPASAKSVSATLGAPMPQVMTVTPALDRLPVNNGRPLNDQDNHKDGQVWPRIENL
jgi:alpha-glucosidase